VDTLIRKRTQSPALEPWRIERIKKLLAEGLSSSVIQERLGVTGNQIKRFNSLSRKCACGRQIRRAREIECFVCRGWPINKAQYRRLRKVAGEIARFTLSPPEVIVRLFRSKVIRGGAVQLVVGGKAIQAEALPSVGAEARLRLAAAITMRPGDCYVLLPLKPTGALTSRRLRPLVG
jgi:hypothetical protein